MVRWERRTGRQAMVRYPLHPCRRMIRLQCIHQSGRMPLPRTRTAYCTIGRARRPDNHRIMVCRANPHAYTRTVSSSVLIQRANPLINLQNPITSYKSRRQRSHCSLALTHDNDGLAALSLLSDENITLVGQDITKELEEIRQQHPIAFSGHRMKHLGATVTGGQPVLYELQRATKAYGCRCSGVAGYAAALLGIRMHKTKALQMSNWRRGH